MTRTPATPPPASDRQRAAHDEAVARYHDRRLQEIRSGMRRAGGRKFTLTELRRLADEHIRGR